MRKIVKDDCGLEVVEYDKSMGEYMMPPEYRELLVGKTLEEQVEYFGVVKEENEERSSYGSVDSSSHYTKPAIGIWEPYYCIGIVVDEGIIVGLWTKIWDGSRIPLFLNKCTCIYFACDDDGTGSTSVDDYVTFVWRG
ncbi:MAG: hypothetical protein J6Q52_00700 [Clostridia bacterium]|nr:hypothetical protein [Clostridia bacterium]